MTADALCLLPAEGRKKAEEGDRVGVVLDATVGELALFVNGALISMVRIDRHGRQGAEQAARDAGAGGAGVSSGPREGWCWAVGLSRKGQAVRVQRQPLGEGIAPTPRRASAPAI